MKFLVIPLLLFCNLGFSQSFEQLRASAASNLNRKDYCAALTDFKAAFAIKVAPGPYDYIGGVSAAANCNAKPLALQWLQKSFEAGLGKSEEEITYLETNESFRSIADTEAFKSILKRMKERLAEKEADKKAAVDAWNKAITAHQLPPQQPYQHAPQGYALYFTQVDDQQVPFVVYVPNSYDPVKPSTTIVFLHGGVNSVQDYYYKNPDVATEPIFSIGEAFNAIIIYPFAKKDFGWMNQKKAFENIFTILKETEGIYNVDTSRIYLGGMSNGGTATFWFASQKDTPFKAFYAFGANPVLKIEEIDFANISNSHPLYTIHSKDDEVFKYDEVISIYNANKKKAVGWKFETIEKGSHGFIYDPENGPAILYRFFKELLK
ncbi:dienelactone hydrolase family protein [Chitinophaga sp. Hz27]|uniref:dienelactone hydrolase family protein n=1 Tax=Chitinophaga sp. Hz27 TaxID=3347169 RepID=UPI0035DBDB11